MSTRIAADDVLQHPVRATLLSIIQDDPGVSFLGLFERLRGVAEFASGLGYGSLSYHLQLLERFGHITTRKAGRYRRHYANGGPWNGDTTALAVLQTEPVPRLAELLLSNPGRCQQELWRALAPSLPRTRQSVAYQLKRLERLGLVVTSRQGPAKRYWATEKLLRLKQYARGAPEPALAPALPAAARNAAAAAGHCVPLPGVPVPEPVLPAALPRAPP